MKVFPLARYLRDHSAVESRAGDAGGKPAQTQLPIPKDRKVEIDEAYARGLEEGQAVAHREQDALLKAAEDRHESRLAQERARWVIEESKQLSAAIDNGLKQVDDAVAEAVARLLQPLLAADARKRALDDLRKEIQRLWEKAPGLAMTISGPADLLEALRTALVVSEAIEFVAAANCELRVEIGNTVIETALARWSARVSEVMA